MDHLHGQHSAAQLVELETLGKFILTWTVTLDTWRAALCPDVSGVATDVQLFHQCSRRLVHRYMIHKDPLPHVYLWGPVIRNLSAFVN